MTKLGIMSDIHGNLGALQQALRIFAAQKVERVYCAGDMVGYGPNPDECCRLVRENADAVVAGNHDYAVCDRIDYVKTFNPQAMIGIQYAKQFTYDNNRHWLQHLPLTYKNDALQMVHCSLARPEAFYYLKNGDSRIDDEFFQGVAHTFNRLNRQVCFVGHTHHPKVYFEDKYQEITARPNYEAPIQLGGRRAIVDVGSVGLPRLKEKRASIVIYDTQSETIVYHWFEIESVSLPEEIVEAFDWPDIYF